ncbi:MAG: tRNA (N(6)-L-threonylcarbamoyladenosine(37)-C(2))-methylthiotransferase MtaB [Clostridium sp.]|nr:tRNA (N(6)-L-threonylcarbamoyladenosine(37)-C(2))-methylthiotransferase MtaB [Clostridium sp.]MCM1444659.1 tRNA (N(6)-L-threonylcarbamoyladenosine(37)-C(2))-methylthiotransferase MtaB [Candidatus Amulumruptor caecigallinarius]
MKFYIYTLGCKVNAYESSIMQEDLENHGYVKVDSEEYADICIINTCTVTNTADNKSLKVIRKVVRDKKNKIVVVTGCLSQTNPTKVSFDGVDIIIGNKNKSKISSYIDEYIKKHNKKLDICDLSSTEFETMKLNNFNKTRAFIKIQDGCNNFCSYCIIPYSRGNVRSKKKEDVLEEVNNIIKNGHKEIVLTGIHTGNYGVEFENYDFAALLLDLVKLKLDRIRISSIEITELNDRVIDVIKNNDIIVDHLHIPLQSGSDKILKLMNRKYDIKYFMDKLNILRKIRKDISITTDIIVGFPGETEEDFNDTLNNSKLMEFSKIHVFPYSKRDNTKAATMENQVSDIVKKQRVLKLINLSRTLEKNYINKFIGKKLYFIPEIYKDGYLIGHTGNYLLIKAKGNEKLLNKEVEVLTINEEYPMILSKII